jgi:large subunit ribosomal protein L18
MSVLSRTDARRQRHARIRKKVSGTAAIPRMSIAVSLKQMHVQFIDDEQGVTLASSFAQQDRDGKNVATARKLGLRAGELLLARGIDRVVVDRGGFRYHGRVRGIVEGAMSSGIRVGSAVLPPDPAEAKTAKGKSDRNDAGPGSVGKKERKEKK